MPQSKYTTDQERQEALRQYRHKYYQRKREDKEWLESRRIKDRQYYKNNKEKCLEYKANHYKMKKTETLSPVSVNN